MDIGLLDFLPEILQAAGHFLLDLGLSLVFQMTMLASLMQNREADTWSWVTRPLTFAALRCAGASVAFLLAVPFLFAFYLPGRMLLLGASAVFAAMVLGQRCKPVALYLLSSVAADLIPLVLRSIAQDDDPDAQVAFRNILVPMVALAILGVAMCVMRPKAR
jgi:hypothetical protein